MSYQCKKCSHQWRRWGKGTKKICPKCKSPEHIRLGSLYATPLPGEKQ